MVAPTCDYGAHPRVLPAVSRADAEDGVNECGFDLTRPPTWVGGPWKGQAILDEAGEQFGF
jgi:hypothetical protein